MRSCLATRELKRTDRIMVRSIEQVRETLEHLKRSYDSLSPAEKEAVRDSITVALPMGHS